MARRTGKMQRCKALLILPLLGLLGCTCSRQASAAVYSQAWGAQGEHWQAPPAGRLLDFSYAGYAAGEAPLPDPTPTHNIQTDFGAKGDGITDDTAMFARAFIALPDGSVLLVPPGIYIITAKLQIKKRISIKGAGIGLTVLRFPMSLQDLYGGPDPAISSAWSTGPGFITISGSSSIGASAKLTNIMSSTERGCNTLQVASTAGLVRGQWVTVSISDVRGNVMRDMTSELAVGCTDPICVNATNVYRFTSRVTSVDPTSRTVVLERRVPFNISSAFKPALYKFAPTLSDAGMSGVTLDFQSGQYKGHFHEEGWNGIFVNKAANVYLSNIQIRNADIGIQMGECTFCTVSNISIEADAGRALRGVNGHHALWAKAAQDTLFTAFNVSAPFVHDLTVEAFATGTVFASGSGADLTLDHHSMSPLATLWTDLDVGAGTRAWVFGGDLPRFPPSGPLSTFFRITASKSKGNAINGKGPPSYMGPLLNFIGCGGSMAFPRNTTNAYVKTWHVEKLDPAKLLPASLYQAQWALRMSSPGYVSSAMGGEGTGGNSTLARES